LKTKIGSNAIFWLVYLALLAVLLPHTAWAFASFEPNTPVGQVTAWFAALAFEAGLATLTAKLAKRIEETPRRCSFWRRAAYRYASPYFAGLLLSIAVSALANLAHSVEYGQALGVFTRLSIPRDVYSLAFGGILPIASLLFAWVLSQDTVSEQEDDPALAQAKDTISELRVKVRQAEQRATTAEEVARRAEALLIPGKPERIRAIKAQWPALANTAVAILGEASPAYVSEVLSANGNGHSEEVGAQ
jgi:hypothetical protein